MVSSFRLSILDFVIYDIRFLTALCRTAVGLHNLNIQLLRAASLVVGHRTVIVCHWGRRDGTGVFQISEFDYSGNNIKSFCGEDDLNDFPHVCLDLSDRPLVVDSWNSRVVLLNKDLQLIPSCLVDTVTGTQFVSKCPTRT